VRVKGVNKRGQGARLSQILAENGLNLRGLSAAAIGNKFVCHISVDTEAETNKVMRVLGRL
jgi:predicted amino acid-binding ACT domain protein